MSMRVVVGYQWCASPKAATVRADGTVSWVGAQRLVGTPDRVAIELARQLADSAGARLIGVTVGDREATAPEASSAAAACGLDATVLITCDGAPDTADVAAALAHVVRGMGDVRVVVLGSCAADGGTRMVGPVLGGLLGWPVLTDVRDVNVDDAGLLDVVDESRATPRRSRITGPAVLTTTIDARVPRPLGLRQILAAGAKPSTFINGADLATGPDGRVEVLDRAPVDLGHRLGRVITERDPRRAAALLVEGLTDSGAL